MGAAMSVHGVIVALVLARRRHDGALSPARTTR
jgi:hypothetical protein